MILLAAAFLLFVLLNIAAFWHARRLLRYNRYPLQTKTKSAFKLSTAERVRVIMSGVRLPRPQAVCQPSDFGVAHETIFFPSRRGRRLEAWKIESKEKKGTVVLFHAYVEEKSQLLPEAKAFRDMGYESILVDMSGCGGSSGTTSSLGVRESRDVEAVYNALREADPKGRIILYGKSMGASAVMRAASKFKLTPEAIILEAPFSNLFQTVARRWRELYLPTFPFLHLVFFWGSVQMGSNGFRHNPVRYAKSVRSPVLILHGRHDRYNTLEDAGLIFDALRTKKELRVFSESGHGDLVRREPKRWSAEVSTFLDGISKS